MNRNKYILIFFLFSWAYSFGQQRENVFLLNHWNGDWVNSNQGGFKYNEVWGFVHEGEEYAVIGSVNGTHIFHLTSEDELIEVDFIAGAYSGSNLTHRDYHNYAGHLYAVCDQGSSTLQIMDLSYLPDSVSVVYDDDSLVVTSHNVFIDSSSALMYICKSNGDPMEVYSLADPLSPDLVYKHFGFTYVHDVFARNDTAYLASGQQGLWVYDFSTPATPTNLGSLEFYPDQGFNHSGWLNDDGTVYVMADETAGMRLKVCDVSELTDIQIHALFGTGLWDETLPHNVMVKDDIAYVSYYNDGLRIYNIRDAKNPKMIGYYDTFTGANDRKYEGAWGIYAFLPSGKLLVSDRTSGLFVFKYQPPVDISSSINEGGVYPNPASDHAVFYLNHSENHPYTLSIYSTDGKLVDVLDGNFDHLDIDLSQYSSGTYTYTYFNATTNNRVYGKFIRE